MGQRSPCRGYWTSAHKEKRARPPANTLWLASCKYVACQATSNHNPVTPACSLARHLNPTGYHYLWLWLTNDHLYQPSKNLILTTRQPKWRNWQTRRIQNPVRFTPGVGSTPTFGISSADLMLGRMNVVLQFDLSMAPFRAPPALPGLSLLPLVRLLFWKSPRPA